MNNMKANTIMEFERCPKHDIPYPVGGECPKCAAEKGRDKPKRRPPAKKDEKASGMG